jgi:transposase InsO family protein
MRWILTLKDHFTGFTVLDSLPKKEALFVAHPLDYIFGIIGYSTKVFHTDNGTDFIAKEVVEMVKKINPSIVMVTGRPRKPSDQGLVERQNQWLKKVKKSLENEGHIAGGETNWVLLLPLVMASLNSCRGGKTRKAASAYESVFGMPYHFPVVGSMEEMRKCNTVGDLVKLGGTSEAFSADDYDLTEELEFDSKPAAKDDPILILIFLIPNWPTSLILLLLSLIQIPPLKMILLIFLLSSLFPDMMRID